MKPIAQDAIVAVVMGVTFGMAWHNRRHIRRWAGQMRWKIDRHGRFLMGRQVDISQWMLELSTYCVKESARLSERDEMLYGNYLALQDRVDAIT